MAEAQLGGGPLHPVDHVGVELHRGEPGQAPRGDPGARFGGQLLQKGGQAVLGLGQQIVVGVAHVHGEHRIGGHHVHQVGVQLHPPHGAHLRRAELGGQLVDEHRDAGGGPSGVVAHVHGGGAGVVRLASHGDLGPADALHPGDRADHDALGVEDRTLLDVQFDEGMGRRRRARGRTPVADAVELLAHHRAVGAHHVERLLQGHLAGVHQAAQHVGREPGTLLVGEEPHRQGPPGGDAGPLHRLHHLQSGQHAQVAVVAPAGAHGVDVAAAHHRRPRLGPGQGAHHVADAVDADLHAQVPHPGDNEVAAVPVFVGQSQSAGTVGALDFAYRGQSGQAVAQALTIDADISSHRRHILPEISPAGYPAIANSPYEKGV